MSRKIAPIWVHFCKEVTDINQKVEKRIGHNIRQLREKAGVTQEWVAAQLQLNGCDITRSAIAKIEVGQRHLYPDEIILLRDILHTSYEEIFALKKRLCAEPLLGDDAYLMLLNTSAFLAKYSMPE